MPRWGSTLPTSISRMRPYGEASPSGSLRMMLGGSRGRSHAFHLLFSEIKKSQDGVFQFRTRPVNVYSSTRLSEVDLIMRTPTASPIEQWCFLRISTVHPLAPLSPLSGTPRERSGHALFHGFGHITGDLLSERAQFLVLYESDLELFAHLCGR
jgi:hypothetical protein